MLPSFLVPLALVAAIALLIPRSWISGPSAKRAVVQIVLLSAGLVVLRYLWWRVSETMPLSGTSTSELVFYWSVLTIEVMVWVDTAILFLMISRPRSNSEDADRGELILRAMPSGDLPTVDVFIATYNEDLDVLEKTIIGTKALDWPQEKLRICVLDDGKRGWLEAYCGKMGVDYFTRANNEHAKAGNINAAIARTDGEYFMVLDADFIPQENFLYRSMGLFEDPEVGIVQIPHGFYNADPMQANLGLRRVLPDDQRMFFGTIMAGRDGWNAAFCCGSNSVTRRSAIEEIGNKLPTGSITEDMLLTLALLRKGYVTRYLNERLAIGLAPESLSAMYIQRARWARGAVQILFLKEGPFGPGLKLHERLMFVPLHWLAQSLVVMLTLLTPAICLWTNWSPLPTATSSEILSMQFPALLAVMASLRLVAPSGFFPLASMVHTCLQAPRILPTVISTLIRPHGHAFQVTPKGDAAGGSALDKAMIFLPGILIAITAAGIFMSTDINTRIVSSTSKVPFLVGWGVFSMVVLSIVQAVAISSTAKKRDEALPVREVCVVRTGSGVDHSAFLESMSLSEARLRSFEGEQSLWDEGWILLLIPGFGPVPGFVTRITSRSVRVALHLPEGVYRDELIRFIFTQGRDNSVRDGSSIRIALAMLIRAAGWKRSEIVARAKPEDLPKWLRAAQKSCEVE